jgi:hypothetical protein
MKILFITYHYLSGKGGGVFASRAFINAFAEIAEEISLVYPDNGKKADEEIHDKVILHGVPWNQNIIKKILRLLSSKLHNYKFRWILEEVIKDRQFDLVVFDTGMMGDLVRRFRKMGFKTITIHHNSQVEYFRDNNRILLFLSLGLFGKFVWKSEKNSILNSTINFTLTRSDRETLIKNYHPKEDNAIINIGCFKYSRAETKSIPVRNNQIPTFAISGNLGAVQTYKSVVPFLTEYLPLISNDHENFSLIVAGKNPTKETLDLCKRNESIRVVPNPENIDEIICEADIYICPVNLGSGIKLRVMDGLKLGMPVIAHENSARGYEDFSDAGFLFSYADPNSFVTALRKAVIKSREDPGEEIIKLYRKLFSFDSGVERVRHSLRRFGIIK